MKNFLLTRTFCFSSFYTVVLCAALVGCGSSVKLEDVPVENRSTTVTQPGTGAASGSDTRGVAPVQVDTAATAQAGPANTVRIIYFDFDSFVVKPEFQSVIDVHSRFLLANKNRSVSIEGHTDEKGGREYNLALGQKRAEAVRRSMTLLGVSENQIEAVSFGKEKPIALGSDDTSLAKNRRAEITYR